MTAASVAAARAKLLFCAGMTHANKIRASAIVPGGRWTSSNPLFKREFPSCLRSRQAARHRRCTKPPAARYGTRFRRIGAIPGRWVHFGSTGPLEGEQRGNRFAGRGGAQAEQLVDGLGGKGRIQSGVLLVTYQVVFSHMSSRRRRSPGRNVAGHVPWNRYCRLSVGHR
jgi:hypothetical protein